MSEHYVRLAKDPAFWFVNDEGERHPVADQEELMVLGIFPVKTISAEELKKIPLVGQTKKKAKPKEE